MIMDMDQHKEMDVVVIKKKVVDLEGAAFKKLALTMAPWRLGWNYRSRVGCNYMAGVRRHDAGARRVALSWW